MDSLFGGYKSTYPSVNPKDRFVALKEARILLHTRKISLEHLCDFLFKPDNGSAEFVFGDIVLQFTRGFGVWSERKDVVQMTVEVQKDEVGDVVGYEYTREDVMQFSRHTLEDDKR